MISSSLAWRETPSRLVVIVNVGQSPLTYLSSVPALSALPEPLADHRHRRQGLLVVHPGRAQDADRTGPLAFDLVRGDDDRAVGERLDAVLGADGDRQAPVEDVADQADQDELLLEDVEHLADGRHRVERGGHPGGAADEDL